MINAILTSNMLVLLAEAGEEVSLSSDLLIPLAVALVLVLLNGFFVAAEFAILGARATRMEELADDGDQKALKVQDIIEDKYKQNSYLATAQLGITVVTLALSMYAEPRIVHYLEVVLDGALPAAFLHVAALGFLTYLHVVLGEMVPKSMALSTPNQTALKLNRAMSLLQAILIVPIKILNFIGDSFLRLVGVQPAHSDARLYTGEEIEQLVSESTESGLFSEDAEILISNILDFSEREVGQIMTPRRKVEGIDVGTGYKDLLNQVTESRHSRFPVFESDLDHIVGILHLKDLILTYKASVNGDFNMRSIVRPAPVVPENKSVEEMLTAFKTRRLHMAVVLDEFGGMSGIVTLEDLVEEVVGEVRDEFDVEREPFVELESGLIEVAGSYLLSDLLEDIFLGEEEELPDVDTTGGLVVTLLGGPPKVDDEVELNSVKFKVIGVDERAITRVRINFPAPKKNYEKNSESETSHSHEEH